MADQKKYTAKLVNTRCLVIGGTSGLGYSVAENLVESGAIVIISSSNPERIAGAVEKLQSAYPSKKAKISGLQCDLSKEESLESNIVALLEAATEKNTEKLDHVVHTAGDGLSMRGLQNMTMETIKKGGMVRYFSVLLLGKHIASYTSGGPAASLTLTTGSVSQRPFPGVPAAVGYATALHGVTRALALDLKPLRVNIVCPGAVITELWDSLPKEVWEGVKKDMESKAPTGKIGLPEDVSEAYLYAIKDQNLTGSVISTNGGSLLVG